MAQVKDYSVEEKLTSLIKFQKVDCKFDDIQILKGELPIEVSDLEDEISRLLQPAKTSIEEEVNGIQQFIEAEENNYKECRGTDIKNMKSKAIM